VPVRPDAHRDRVAGALAEGTATGIAGSSTYRPGPENRVRTGAGRRLGVRGRLDTSHGRVTTAVTRALAPLTADRSRC
jgi:hypothetical protein